ncbi:MAG: HAMP domain-containing protein, partial [Bacillus sp. (in: firmicutes)]
MESSINMKLSGKIFAGFFIMTVVAAIVGYYAGLDTPLLLTLIGVLLIVGIVLSSVISSSIRNPLRRVVHAAEKIAKGDVNVNFEDINDAELSPLVLSLDKIAGNIRTQSEIADKIAKGDFDFEVKVQSEHDLLSKSVKTVMETMRSFIHETEHMAKLYTEGDIDALI